jgi:hypothetical protein
MANEIQISAVTGLAISLQLYSGAATVGSSFGATEIGTTGEYISNMPIGVPYGVYMILATVGADVKIASGIIYWDGHYELLDSLSKLEGLDAGNPMTVTPTSRDTGDIALVITGDGETSTTVTAT